MADRENAGEVGMTPTEQLMAHIHEMFITATSVGFSHGEALYLAAAVLSGGPRVPTKE